MKYWFRLFMLIGCVLSVFAAIGWALPHGYQFTASIEIDAPPAEVYQRIDTTPEWQAWSQWNPDTIENLTVEYGVDGKSQNWTDVRGSGKLWFVDQKLNEQIDYRMRFANFPEMDATIRLDKNGSSTKVVWTSAGQLPPSPLYGFFRHIFEGQMKMQYEQSLTKLKQVIEQPEHSETPTADKSAPASEPEPATKTD